MSRPGIGPRLVRGIGFVVDRDGVATVANRPVVALCRCDGSGRLPWCDSTHKVLCDSTHQVLRPGS